MPVKNKILPEYRNLVKCPYCEEAHPFDAEEKDKLVITCTSCSKEFFACKKYKKDKELKPIKIKKLRKVTKKEKKVK